MRVEGKDVHTPRRSPFFFFHLPVAFTLQLCTAARGGTAERKANEKAKKCASGGDAQQVEAPCQLIPVLLGRQYLRDFTTAERPKVGEHNQTQGAHKASQRYEGHEGARHREAILVACVDPARSEQHSKPQKGGPRDRQRRGNRVVHLPLGTLQVVRIRAGNRHPVRLLHRCGGLAVKQIHGVHRFAVVRLPFEHREQNRAHGTCCEDQQQYADEYAAALHCRWCLGRLHWNKDPGKNVLVRSVRSSGKELAALAVRETSSTSHEIKWEIVGG
ncbi:hypothetical protein, conserved [Leishmania tarentolae]|uniref:Secreted protein n=1 Tax=Leishmania tarentolae TaxID=5689 RepID=A0A640KDA3_LEITA|nr:hypothetical protein, conserved [Leishmania tarentolae]